MAAVVDANWLEAYNADPKGMQRGWVDILGPHPLMPRDVMVPWKGKGRYLNTVHTTQQYLKVIEDHAAKGDMWVGMYPTTLYTTPVFNRLYGDVDDTDLENGLRRARRLEERMMQDFEVQPATLFSAGKGFHLHVEHEPVLGNGTAYEESVMTLLAQAQGRLDAGPLKNRKAMPRIPYTFNSGSHGKHGHAMYCVPVDLSWDLEDILTAARELIVTPFKVPRSKVLADLLTPLMERSMERHARMDAKGRNGKGRKDLVTAAIKFSEGPGLQLRNARGNLDGRRRLMFSLYVPALMVEQDGDLGKVLPRVEAWIGRTKASWVTYKVFAEQTARQCYLPSGDLRSPMSLQRFFAENSDLTMANPANPRKRQIPVNGILP